MRFARLFSVLVLAAGVPLARAQSADAPPDALPETLHDLRIGLRPEQPLLAELRFELRATMEASSEEESAKFEVRHQTRLDFVDELLAQEEPAPGDLDVRRTYLVWSRDGSEGRAKPTPRDNAFVGVSVLVTRRAGVLSLELVDRLAPEEELQELMKHCESVAWLALPAGVRVGESFELDPAALVNLLLDEAFAIQAARGKLTLSSVDEAGLATLDGSLLVMVQDEESVRGTFEGAWTVQLDTREKCLRTIEWKGKALMLRDEDSVRGELRGEFVSRLTLQAGEPARAALARKVVYRSVPRPLARAPVRLELASHWYAVADEEKEVFRTTVHGAESFVTLQLSFLDLAGQEFDAVANVAVAEFEKQVRLSDKRNAPSPFGQGRSVRYQQEVEGILLSFAVELYPCGKNRLMRVTLAGVPQAFDQEFREWQKTLRTFELTE